MKNKRYLTNKSTSFVASGIAQSNGSANNPHELFKIRETTLQFLPEMLNFLIMSCKLMTISVCHGLGGLGGCEDGSWT